MILSHCPRCSESIRIPTGEVPDDAYAQCPWCRETFPASELIDQLPPVVQLMDSGGNPLVVSSSPVVAGDAQPNPFAGAVASDSWSGAAATEESGAGQGDQYFNELKFGDEPAAGAVDIQVGTSESASLEERPTRVRARQPKKKKSSIGTMIGVALGPVLALPLAGGILLALGRAPDLGFWPFDGTYNGGAQQRSAAPRWIPVLSRNLRAVFFRKRHARCKAADRCWMKGATSPKRSRRSQAVMNWNSLTTLRQHRTRQIKLSMNWRLPMCSCPNWSCQRS